MQSKFSVETRYFQFVFSNIVNKFLLVNCNAIFLAYFRKVIINCRKPIHLTQFWYFHLLEQSSYWFLSRFLHPLNKPLPYDICAPAVEIFRKTRLFLSGIPCTCSVFRKLTRVPIWISIFAFFVWNHLGKRESLLSTAISLPKFM